MMKEACLITCLLALVGVVQSMMDELSETGRYEVDLPMKRKAEDGSETSWYCRVLALRHKDPLTGQPIVMISHQDVTALRNVEGELGRIQMKAETNKGLMAHDSDVAGSLLTLLGEDWEMFSRKNEDATSQVAEAEPGEFERGLSGDHHGPSMGSNKLNALRGVLEKADDWHFDVCRAFPAPNPLRLLFAPLICRHVCADDEHPWMQSAHAYGACRARLDVRL